MRDKRKRKRKRGRRKREKERGDEERNTKGGKGIPLTYFG
jgi:hypothetical protein